MDYRIRALEDERRQESDNGVWWGGATERVASQLRSRGRFRAGKSWRGCMSTGMVRSNGRLEPPDLDQISPSQVAEVDGGTLRRWGQWSAWSSSLAVAAVPREEKPPGPSLLPFWRVRAVGMTSTLTRVQYTGAVGVIG